MRYLGGKARIAGIITEYLNNVIVASKVKHYLEPFVGSGWILEKIECEQRIGSDLHEDLILLWQAIQSGWQPPLTLGEEEYNKLKSASPSALRGFAGFGCSFSGKWFGGYARDNTGRNYAGNACRSILSKVPNLSGVEFYHCSYNQLPDTEGAVIYCDPPYQGVTTYKGVEPFDHEAFWEWVREKSKSNFVFVSEYSAPDDFEAILEINTKLDMHSKQDSERVEKLFRLRS